jgi:hypothetical protein
VSESFIDSQISPMRELTSTENTNFLYDKIKILKINLGTLVATKPASLLVVQNALLFF